MYQLGDFKADTKKQLGIEVVNGIGLGLENDENIGRRVKFKNGNGTIYILIARQKAWGYDEYGNYTMLNAYRGVEVEEGDNFGRPLHLYEVEFID